MDQLKQQYEFILIRLGEIALKGKNRKHFEVQLQENLKMHLKDLDVRISRTFGRMYIHLNGAAFDEVAERLKHVFGITSFSPAIKSDLELDHIKQAALKLS